MEIRVEQAQGRVPVTIFHIVGSIHLGNVESLETQARAAISSGSRNLLINLTDVPTMTSAGLRVLHLLYKLLGNDAVQQNNGQHDTEQKPVQAKSARLKLANPSPAMLRVLTIAGFDTFLEIHETVPEAVASF